MRKERRLPAEWEQQQGILLCFPGNGNDWPGKYQTIQFAFAEFIKKIAATETVFVLVGSESIRDKAISLLEAAHVNLSKVTFIIQKTNRSWMRDAGPIIVKTDEGREALNFNFNGWAKYGNFRLDKQVPKRMGDFLGIPVNQIMHNGESVILEGGAIDVNGKGTLLTTEECLLDPEVQVRNPNFTREDYELIFKKYLGVINTIWLGDGIAGDDTHGHVDDLCRFVNENTIVTVVEEDQKDANYKPLQDNLKRLQQAKLEDGSSPVIVTLPMPKAINYEDLRVPASYANFLILNKTVLVPTFNDAKDRIALNTLAELFPDREVIGIGAIDLIWGLGTLHCLSMQIPE
ncbi:agmatine deiminase family protein [Leeuwenhoekiella parthenopeia]|uniref:Agmatine deiminase family protein n=1 Tax=Leeuwenhoekiella parthenopeia TaxID=2890320 RepID=A0ABS8GSN5_9FLAO|nr:agmatine deiminase family protein [Leeuwenhoekiella parthenopeia]MCC4213005.1 agmatine deiminase family protein [Leeuwenhoekiella parthenopeia]